MAPDLHASVNYSGLSSSNNNVVSHATNDVDYIFKILVCGDSGTGKSSLVLRYCDNAFSETFLSTIGVDFRIRTIELDGKIVKLQIWDTAGQDRFKAIVQSYYRHAHGVLVVYDTTDYESFVGVRTWLESIAQHAPENVTRLLVGNKSDLVSKRTVQYGEAQSFASSLGMSFVETSARNDVNVEQAFVTMAREIKLRVDAEGSNRKGIRAKDDINLRGKKVRSVTDGADHTSSCCTIL